MLMLTSEQIMGIRPSTNGTTDHDRPTSDKTSLTGETERP